MIQAGIDVVLIIDGKPVAGQQNAQLIQTMTPIDITNRINGSWRESLTGLRSWQVNCGGMYVVNASSLKRIEEAFMNNEELTARIVFNGQNYFGRVLITDFPLSSIFNGQFKYNISLLGTGELSESNN